eukprot:CAMPEP_0195509124 /NCGR_PEP_ID=MMETSP0794_2-20130614/2143_1 /TAXON_ID=515487 /ORGANISM="Stephanopyxis turris, Strain CCMP 815" /LENGTH=475 /DNA_ID=CAMNT_0040636265 /DNA_START=641 /DNA_END=2068 /DNA_ORIENTATION=-
MGDMRRASAAASDTVPAKRARLSKKPGSTPNSVAENPIGDNHTPRVACGGGLEDLAEKYTLGSVLGEGTFGLVQRASNKLTGEIVALKMINTVPKNRVEYGFPEAVLREIKILRHLRFHVSKPHPNIITLRDIVLHRQKENTICLVMDFMDIDLHLLLSHIDRQLPFRVGQYYLYQLLNAVNFVHGNSILHRDLKPSNIVVNSQHQLKVVDWGLGRVFRNDAKIRYENTVATPWYKSPELVLGATNVAHGYGPAIDMWAVGCIFVELLWRETASRRLRRTPFDPHIPAPDGSGKLILPPGFTLVRGPTHLTSAQNLWKVITGRLGIPTYTGCNKMARWKEFKQLGLTNIRVPSPGVRGNDRQSKAEEFKAELRLASMSPQAIDLALKLLELNPHERISAPEALAHPFFTRDSNGVMTPGGAVAKAESLSPWENLAEAHSNKLRKAAAKKARQNGRNEDVDDHWKGSGGVDMLGED